MPKYMYIFHANRSAAPAPEDQEAAMQAWGAWMAGIGDKMVDPGAPVGLSKLVTANGVTDEVPSPAFGYTIVEAASMDEACAMAKGNPMLDAPGGAVEVAEIVPMSDSPS